MENLKGQRAVVIGGTSGVGLATARAFLERGAIVVIAGRKQDKLDAARKSLGGDVRGHTVDARDEKKVEAFFAEVGEHDHLVITAGETDPAGPLVDSKVEWFRATFEGKFWPQLYAARHGAVKVRKGGSITLFSGAASRRAIPGLSNIAAVNGALDAMVGPLARELAPTRVNAIAPGTLDTPYFAGMPEENRKAIFARMAGLLPVGRVGTAEDIANAVMFLATTGYVTGIVLEVDGGIRQAAI